MPQEHTVSYQASNTYSTLNSFNSSTKNVWIVFHGLGYLSRFFSNYFKELPPKENYIIAPQAPSKYYQGSDFKYVGASWLTRENTKAETQNVLSYVDAVWAKEMPTHSVNLIVLGYSQGVSIAARWLATRKIMCTHLILHSGAIPVELTPADFEFLPTDVPVTYLFGNKDPYITEARKTEQHLKASALFGSRLEIEVFDGVHEVYTPFLKSLVLKKPD